MAWYDVFSRFYDASLEPHYRAQRAAAVEALAPVEGSVVLDLPCGTGQSFPGLVAGVGPTGAVLGVDLSAGMLREAGRRVARQGWTNVALHRGDATTLAAADLTDTAGVVRRPDRLHVFLGMSVFPDPERVFANLWDVLAPGGRCVLVDVHAERVGLQGRMVECLARADLTRRWWEPLARVASDFARHELPSEPLHGGAIWLATGTKPLG